MNDKIVNILSEILLDKTARLDERDDAAMDLASYPTQDALNTLIKVASDPTEADILLTMVGESIGSIMYQLKKIDWDIINNLTRIARLAATTQVKAD